MNNTSQKRPQQWDRLIASPGHTLLAQVDAYRLKAESAARLAAIGTMITVAAFFIAPIVGSMIGSSAAWVHTKILGWTKPAPYPKSPAPTLRPIQPVLPRVSFDIGQIPNLMIDVAPAMVAQVEAITAGQKMTDCKFNTKLTDEWFDGKDPTPKCRYSKEGDRLWVWAYVKQSEYQHGPFFGVISKRDGKVTYANVSIPNTLKIPGMPSLDPNRIQRTVAADFPELVIQGGN